MLRSLLKHTKSQQISNVLQRIELVFELVKKVGKYGIRVSGGSHSCSDLRTIVLLSPCQSMAAQ